MQNKTKKTDTTEIKENVEAIKSTEQKAAKSKANGTFLTRKKRTHTEAVPQAEVPKYSFKLLFIVIEHGAAEEVRKILSECGVKLNIICQGKGTANNQIMGLLGLGEPHRDIIISIVEASKAKMIIDKVYNDYSASGVAFAVRLNSIGGMKLIKALQNQDQPK